MAREAIKAYNGRIIGWIDTDGVGNQEVRDFYGRIVGRYDKNLDVTKDFYCRILTKGNTVVGLVYNNQYN